MKEIKEIEITPQVMRTMTGALVCNSDSESPYYEQFIPSNSNPARGETLIMDTDTWSDICIQTLVEKKPVTVEAALKWHNSRGYIYQATIK